MNTKSIILFDGVCNLCNGAVQFIIKRDDKNQFSFASLQSGTGKHLLVKHDLPFTDFNSFVLIENDKVYTRSGAALRVARRLKGLWPLLYCFIIIPKFLRDGVYKLIAKNRYRWFGRQDECMLPSKDLKARFLN